MAQIFPAYQITCADLDRIKVVASRVFGRGISPQSRLEIIARSCGFKTCAALRAHLAKRPVLLTADQAAEETHIEAAGLDLGAIPFIDGIALNEMIAAGLAWTEREAIEEAIARSPAQKLAALKADGPTLKDYLDFLYEEVGRSPGTGHVYRSSLSFSQLRHHREGKSFVLTSPRNQNTLATNPVTREAIKARGAAWFGAEIRLPETARYFTPPKPLKVHWDELLARLAEVRKIYVFDEEDEVDLRRILIDRGLRPDELPWIATLHAAVLEMEGVSEGDFFTDGYYGTSRNEAPAAEQVQSSDALGTTAYYWLCEIVNVVHGCDYEWKRMHLGLPGERIYRQDLVVTADLTIRH